MNLSLLAPPLGGPGPGPAPATGLDSDSDPTRLASEGGFKVCLAPLTGQARPGQARPGTSMLLGQKSEARRVTGHWQPRAWVPSAAGGMSGASNSPACSESGGDSKPDRSWNPASQVGTFQAPSPSRTGSDPGDSEPAPHCRPCFAASASRRVAFQVKRSRMHASAHRQGHRLGDRMRTMTRFNFTSWHQLLGSNSPAVRSCLVSER